MAHIDVPLRIHEHDTLVLDGAVLTIRAINGDEIQVASGSMLDSIYTVEEMEQKIAEAEEIYITRQ